MHMSSDNSNFPTMYVLFLQVHMAGYMQALYYDTGYLLSYTTNLQNLWIIITTLIWPISNWSIPWSNTAQRMLQYSTNAIFFVLD